MRGTAVVVGAGVAGLSAAVSLRNQGWNVRVREGSSRFGGCLYSERTSGGVLEWGASSLLGSHEAFDSAMELSGCQDKLREASTAAKARYIWWKGGPRKLPSGFAEALASPLVGGVGLLRLVLEPFMPRTSGDPSVRQFVTRRLGSRIADRLADPFVSGVWAGDSRRLKVRHALPRFYSLERLYRSLLVGAYLSPKSSRRKGLFSLKGGLQTLAEGLASKLGEGCVEMKKKLDDFTIGEEGVVLTYQDGSSETADRLVLATDGLELSRLMKRHDGGFASALRQAPRAEVGVVHMGFNADSSTRPRGYGMLVGALEAYEELLGILHVSDIFPRDDDITHLCAYVGGRRFPNVASWNVSQLEALAVKAARGIYGLGEPSWVKAAFARPGIPQYEGGQTLLERQKMRFHQQHPAVRLVGSWQGGVSALDSFKAARDTMEAWS